MRIRLAVLKGMVVGEGGPFNSDGESVTGDFDGAVTRMWELEENGRTFHQLQYAT